MPGRASRRLEPELALKHMHSDEGYVLGIRPSADPLILYQTEPKLIPPAIHVSGPDPTFGM